MATPFRTFMALVGILALTAAIHEASAQQSKASPPGDPPVRTDRQRTVPLDFSGEERAVMLAALQDKIAKEGSTHLYDQTVERLKTNKDLRWSDGLVLNGALMIFPDPETQVGEDDSTKVKPSRILQKLRKAMLTRNTEGEVWIPPQ